ncbi:BCCT family transporter [Halotalea alkalilenta]|uniref:Choline transporter n=1 Tax=Halotalea alkalilenta TaxID=376489 RepID=A0A172YJ36_9GAMM|nr:choline BCCT transporter BetT [Halotalea alkalilenta]ANF59196.1 choline transporter [Halotalea alkalilenta]
MADSSSPRSSINPPVFYSSALVILAFVLFAVIAPEFAGNVFGAVQSWITDTMGWFYLLAMGVFLIFCFVVAFTRYGKVKIGLDHEEAEYSYGSWFAMLFAAGMGIGIMYFGVAEPVSHYLSPPTGEGSTPAAARLAMESTFFHWGLHPWAVYAVVALALGYSHFRHGLPLRISSALYPLIGNRIYGPIGNAVDVFAVFGTMFGLATSLGLGVLQINSGLTHLFDLPNSLLIQLVLIALITAAATASVVAGLDNGIRRLSELNLWMAIALLLFVLVTGATMFMFQTFAQNVGNYLSSVVERSFNMYAYDQDATSEGWLSAWTIFYWGWWISWSPFVGMFIARVSRGRTIRQFIMGVLFVPTGFNFIWMTVFGDGALHMLMVDGFTDLATAVQTDTSLALFAFLDHLPLSSVTSIVALVLIATFFVTSADSGALVIDMLTTKHGEESPTWQRIFWAVGAGVVAMALLVAGGLSALQAASIAAALPFTMILLVVCYGVLRALQIDAHKQDSLHFQSGVVTANYGVHRSKAWQGRLETLVSTPRRQQVREFLSKVVTPAMEEVGRAFEERGLDVKLTQEDDRSYIRVQHGEEDDFVYGVRARAYAAPSFGFGGVRRDEKQEERREYRAEVFLREGGQGYDLIGYSKEQVISDVLDQYEKHLHYLHLIR